MIAISKGQDEALGDGSQFVAACELHAQHQLPPQHLQNLSDPLLTLKGQPI